MATRLSQLGIPFRRQVAAEGVTHTLAGSATGAAAAMGALVLVSVLAGNVQGSSTVAGVLTVTPVDSLSGNIQGTATVSGVLELMPALAGTSSGVATVSAALTDVATYEVIHYVRSPYDNAGNKVVTNRIDYPTGTLIRKEVLIQASGLKWDATNDRLWYHGDGQSNQVVEIDNDGDNRVAHAWLNTTDLEGVTWTSDIAGYKLFITEDTEGGHNADTFIELKESDGSFREIDLSPTYIPENAHCEGIEWVPSDRPSVTYGGYIFLGDQGNSGKIYILEIDVTNHSGPINVTDMDADFNIEENFSEISGMHYDPISRVMFTSHGPNRTISIFVIDSDFRNSLLRGLLIEKIGLAMVPDEVHSEGLTFDFPNRLMFITEDTGTAGPYDGWIHRVDYDAHGAVATSGIFDGGSGNDHDVVATPDSGYRVKEWRVGVHSGGTLVWTPLTGPLEHANTYTIADLDADTVVTVEFEIDPGIMSGSAQGTATVAGALTVDVSHELSGLIQGEATVVGNLFVDKPLGGVIQGQATVVGDLIVDRPLSGACQGQAVVLGSLTLVPSLAGSIQGQATVSGVLTVIVYKGLSGSVQGQATVVGDLDVTLHTSLAGSIQGQATVVGDLILTLELAGSAQGQSVVSGSLFLVRELTGVSQGQATVAGALAITPIDFLSGSVQGQSTVSGGLRITAFYDVFFSSLYINGRIAGVAQITLVSTAQAYVNTLLENIAER